MVPALGTAMLILKLSTTMNLETLNRSRRLLKLREQPCVSILSYALVLKNITKVAQPARVDGELLPLPQQYMLKELLAIPIAITIAKTRAIAIALPKYSKEVSYSGAVFILSYFSILDISESDYPGQNSKADQNKFLHVGRGWRGRTSKAL